MTGARRFVLLGGWAAGILGILGAFATVASTFYASVPPDARSPLLARGAHVFPWVLVCWYALPAISVAIGAALAVLPPRGAWLRVLGESLLLIGVTAGAGLGWYSLPSAKPPIIALIGAADVLAIAVAVVFVVSEMGREGDTPVSEGQGHGD